MTWDILPWALIGGIAGARIWHILTPPASMIKAGITTSYYLTHPLEALSIWKGGLGIPGAVLGGFIAVYIYTRRREVSIWIWADIIAPGLALARRPTCPGRSLLTPITAFNRNTPRWSITTHCSSTSSFGI